MPLNKNKSNMYDWITKTWNPVRGVCEHSCKYCYVKKSRVKKLYEGPPRLIESQFKSLGKNNFWFIGSMIDLFADDIKGEWIKKILEHCRKFDNEYLFQSKNPSRFWEFSFDMPDNCILGTTIETNREYKEMGLAPSPAIRFENMEALSETMPVMVTIEPIMNFDVSELTDMMIYIQPDWINIGADSKNNGLPEPEAWKIEALIKNLRSKNIEVKIKDNLKRLLEV